MNTLTSQVSFTHARITLTVWYCSILAIILFIFSLALYSSQSKDFVRIVLLQDFGNNTPRTLTRIERTEILQQIQALRQTTRVSLLSIDGIIMVFGAGLSFFLAGKTLQPIGIMLEKQTQFLADASHELRTPLSALQTTTEVALRSERSLNEYKTVISDVHEEIVRLGKIVNDLLYLSRADSEGIQKTLQSVDLVPVVHDAVRTLEPLVKKNDLELHLALSEKVIVHGDTDKLKQLVLILIDNAIKYTKKGGSITVQLVEKPKPILKISDTGIGLDNAEVKQIFQRFYRADRSRSTPGVGLGLAIAKSIIEMHNAKITVKSTVGKGSSFSIIFPFHSAH